MIKRSVAGAIIGVVALIAGLLMVAPAQAAPGRQGIPNTAPGWLGRARLLGPASAGAPVSARVYLSPRRGLAALEQEAVALSTPGSAQFRHFLTPSQYFAQFAPSAATVSAVRDWLASSGLKVTGVEAHNRYLAISGSVASVQRAFGVRINRYSHDGITVQAPNTALSAPSAVAGSVLAVSGLDTTPSFVQPATTKPAPPAAGFRNAPPCSTSYGQQAANDQPAFQGQTLPYAICGYVGPQFRAAYEGSTSLAGTGITVAITDAYASPTIASDAATYASRNGDRAYAPGQLTQNLPSVFTRVNNGPRQCGASGWYGEETLDVEAVHAMAQGAKIRYYGSTSCYDQDFIDTLMRVDDEAAAQIVTNSWGSAEQAVKSSFFSEYEALFLQGATEGMSYVFSSGDNGDETLFTGTLQPDYPASDPFVTAVGGTTAAINSTGALVWQTGWGTVKWSRSADGTTWTKAGFLYGSGGGESTIFSQPAYQHGVTPAGARGVPDVAMDGDVTTGMLVGQTQTFPDGVYYDQYRVGGTSLSSPLFAGMTALAFQHAGGGVGLLNPTIYAQSNTGVFTDVTGPGPDTGNVRVDFADSVDSAAGLLYSVRTFDQDTSLTVTPGWDDVTGLGTPNSGWLTATG
jgi:subtilase family serine protease